MKIPKKMMDPIDQQQEEAIERASNLAWGAIWLSALMTIVNFGAFVFAMSQMSKAFETLKGFVK
jgi:hypothetical protein